MKNRTIYRTIVLIPAIIVAACSSSLQIPDQRGNEPGAEGIPFPVGQGQSEGQRMPSPETVGSTGSAGSGDIEDLEEVFDGSLGDFDKQIGQEQVGMSTGGMGSTQSAERRETSDARTAEGRSKKRKRIGVASADKSDGESDRMGGESSGDFPNAEIPSGDQPPREGGTAGDDAGSEAYKGATEGVKDGSSKMPAHKIPEDVVINRSTEDKVSEQIREAAMAEEDPLIREALWEEYRRRTGSTAE